MDPKRRARVEQIAVVGLLAVFGVIFTTSLRRSGFWPGRVAAVVPIEPTHPQGAAAMPESAAPQPSHPAGEAATAATYSASGLRDPLKSLLPEGVSPSPVVEEAPNAPARAPGLPSLVVQGIVWGSERPKAIINDDVYGIGETVEGATITAIGRDGVDVQFEGTTFHVTPSATSATKAPSADQRRKAPQQSSAAPMPPRPGGGGTGGSVGQLRY